MKKALFFTTLFFLLITVIASFITKKETKSVKIKTKPVECLIYSIADAVPFEFEQAPAHASKERKNIADLTTGQISKLKDAITAMKKLSVADSNNPFGWSFQVKIHGGDNSQDDAWGQCQHGNDYFLAWHRMYLYFFEKILRYHMEGDEKSKPGLPYWNYQIASQYKIPLAFRDANAANSLYNSTRNKILNNGGEIDNSYNYYNNKITKIIKNNVDFFNFQDALEEAHGTIHSEIGGDMKDSEVASNDPLFFLHHANVDRLWQKWLAMKGGRCNPDKTKNSKWWNQVFLFYDLEKKKNADGTIAVDMYGKTIYIPLLVKMYGWQLIKVAKDLHYKYDNVNELVTAPAVCNPTKSLSAFSKNILVQSNGTTIVRKITKVKLNAIPTVKVSSFLPMPEQKTVLDSQQTDSFKKIYLQFENVKIYTYPRGVIEVYINPEKLEKLNSASPFFAGIMDLFSLSQNHTHGEGEIENNLSKLNITETVEKLKLSNEDLKKLQIVFVVRGTYLNGVEMPTTVNINIGTISVVGLLANDTK